MSIKLYCDQDNYIRLLRQMFIGTLALWVIYIKIPNMIIKQYKYGSEYPTISTVVTTLPVYL